MRQSGAIKIPLANTQNLRLSLQSSERSAVYDPALVDLERRASRRDGDVTAPAFEIIGIVGVWLSHFAIILAKLLGYRKV